MSPRLVQRLSLFAIAALLVVLSVPGWAGESLVYGQATDYNGGYASQNDASGLGNFATTYDNFTLGSAANINQVTWVGSYISGVGGITGFTVNFYSNAGNAPSSLLASYIVAGTAGETFLQNDNPGNPTYAYVLGLTSNFAAAAGKEYWLSVVPNLAFPPQWLWETSSQGDTNAYQCFFGTCGNISADLAFGLYTPLPEPGSLALLVPGILGLAASLGRKLLG
jgi:hypothetical protein